MTAYERLFPQDFRRTQALARRLMLDSINRKDGALRAMMRYALSKQTPSEYPFVVTYTYCRRLRDAVAVARIAAAIHLLQQSTFITDDIFDRSDLRFHQPTICAKFGTSEAIIAAELMQSVALRSISEDLATGRFADPCRVIVEVNAITEDLYAGQYLDLVTSGDLSVSEKQYLRVIELGAGKFFSRLARCGALLAAKPPEEQERLANWGYNYGMALFISDDILDVRKSQQTGKTYAADLKGRRMRLPALRALRLLRASEAREFRGFLRDKGGDLRRMVHLIEHCGAFDQSTKVVKRYLHKSVESLEGVQGISREALLWLSESLLEAQGLA